MVCFDRAGRLRRYGSAEEIIEDFYPLRLRYYQLRKENMAEKLGRDLQMADNRARFVMEIIQKKLTVNNRKRKDIIQELRDRKYEPMPKKVRPVVAGDPDTEQAAEAEDSGEVSDYDYLLSMPIWNLTMEKVEKLLKEKNDIQQKLEDLLALTPIDLWTTDLEEVEKLWDVMVADYEQRLVDDEENRRSQGGNKGKGKGRARQPTKKAVAAKRKSDTVKIEDDDDFSDKPAAKKVAKTEGNGSSATAAKARAKPKKEAADVKPAVKPKSEVETPAPPPPAEPITLGSDLEDSDEDVAATIFKKAATKRLIGGKQSTLSDMFARKTSVAAAAGVTLAAKQTPVDSGIASSASSPAISASKLKPAAAKAKAVAPAAKGRAASKKMVINSSDEESDGVMSGSDADDAPAPSPPPKARPATSRRAAAVKKPVYMDISDDSGEDFVDGGGDDDDDEFEME
ncbi:DNA topoisomerase 2 [Coemansia sp. S17]|nr:DNA topoisomerase 2 [Coemansia sp. S17]